MRNQPLYILTEDLNFFYMLKRELDKHNVEFQILNLDAKLPTLSSIILTTSEDFEKIEVRNHNRYLVYSKNYDFERYLIKVIAAYRIGYKEAYSTLTFSIDPGNRLGLMIFLDDFYLDSYCCFEINDLTKIIDYYVATFQADNPKLMQINFKLGRGVLSIAFDLVKDIYRIYRSRRSLRVELIDEFRSSKIRFSRDKKIRKISKDEISALILALRNGIEVDQEDYDYKFEQIRNKTLKNDNLDALKTDNHENNLVDLKELIEKVLIGELSLSSAIKLLSNHKT
ncbi:MAG: hypothetical protein ACFE96_08365 [Candidatus Hermodarchaeota archaeon]